MFLVRTNQNLDFYKPHFNTINKTRLETLAWIENYCIKHNINIDVFKAIIFNIYIVEWNLLCQNYKKKYLYQLVKKVNQHYLKLSKAYKAELTNYNYEMQKPFLFDRKFKWETAIFNLKNNYNNSDVFETNDNISNNKLVWTKFYGWNKLVSDIHFVRVQRRYNKRRWSRIRVTSRPSFWSGALLSCLGLGMFWGATLQMTDWITTQLIYVDVTNLLIIMYFYILWRICILLGRGSLYVVRGGFHINQGFRTIIQRNLNNSRWWK
jgi:hypothetical protein